ncbi:MAG: peptidoglycan-binding protein [Clostridia bacterium]|nr:peptidoglycan-binding protein [Clostridia bacterium]
MALAKGTFMVTVRAAGEAFCVSGTSLVVTDENGREVMRETIGDMSCGVSRSVEIEAPREDLSLRPGDEIPYSTCDVVASREGYYTVYVHDAQVFSGETAHLPIEMLPLPEGQSSGELHYTVPPNTVSDSDGDGAPDVTPDVPDDPADERVLSRVYIPTEITVHLGRPESDARNVTVPFIDYIKNVASSEIYPTWPRESLRANILAQISLTLNRSFTEWYPSRGYNFDITNSTAFDQYYVYGRNIFQSISDVVDEVFNQYIRRPGRLEPLFAQYCNGTTVTCDGMSQWGTVTLAQNGLSAEEILEFYYGNIEIVTENVRQSIQPSYPGSPLSIGSSGEAVRTIQRQLNRIARNYPAIPTVTVDGVYGTSVRAQVQAFQRIFNLTADGAVGKRTWYRISAIYTAVTHLGELTSEGERPLYNDFEYPGTPLRRGDVGSDVQAMQFYLQNIAAYNNFIPTLAADGRFGEQTENVVTAFQSFYGLNVDGVVGESTWNKIVSVYKGLEQEEPGGGVPIRPYPGTLLRRGSRGTDVRYVQELLWEIARVFEEIPSIARDGVFGAGTERAVRSFQQIFGLSQDGVVGRRTWDALGQIYTAVQNDCVLSSSDSQTRSYPGTPLRYGSRGSNVSYIQSSLNVIHNSIPRIGVVTADGVFGGATQTQIIRLQGIFGLSQDGVVGSQTWSVLSSVAAAVRSGCLPAVVRAVSAKEEARPVFSHKEEEIPDHAPEEREGESSYPGRALSLGSYGRDVSRIKEALFEKGECSCRALGEKALFGNATRHTVMEFQRKMGLTATGAVDEETWQLIFS